MSYIWAPPPPPALLSHMGTKEGQFWSEWGRGQTWSSAPSCKKTLFLRQQLALNKVTVSSGHAEGLEKNEMPKQNDYKSYLNILTSSLHLSLKFIIFNSPIHFDTIANGTLLWEDILLILIWDSVFGEGDAEEVLVGGVDITGVLQLMANWDSGGWEWDSNTTLTASVATWWSC